MPGTHLRRACSLLALHRCTKANAGDVQDPERHFRHTVNINIFFQLVNEVGLPEVRCSLHFPLDHRADRVGGQTFRFETVDLYDAKNLPKVIYCLHALSQLMARRGLTSRMNDLVGQIDFTGSSAFSSRLRIPTSGEHELTDEPLTIRRRGRRRAKGPLGLGRAHAQLPRHRQGARPTRAVDRRRGAARDGR